MRRTWVVRRSGVRGQAKVRKEDLQDTVYQDKVGPVDTLHTFTSTWIPYRTDDNSTVLVTGNIVSFHFLF